MKKPILVVMAAGLGGRFGGLKQIAPVDEAGHTLADYSIYDARRAGFDRVVFVIAPGQEVKFRDAIGDRLAPYLDIRYACQSLEGLPSGFVVPEGRIRPWGTAHAVLSTKGLVDAPFAVINACDYYGVTAYQEIYRYLTRQADSRHCAIVGHNMENTLTTALQTPRRVCRTVGQSTLQQFAYYRADEPYAGGPMGAETVGGDDPHAGAVAFMGMWGFSPDILGKLAGCFPEFLRECLSRDPLQGEYGLSAVPGILPSDAEIQVLRTPDKWYGLTNAQDLSTVQSALLSFRTAGLYPQRLWENDG